MKKYELVESGGKSRDGNKLYRIRALRDFRGIHEGDFGGFVYSESNLSQEGDCWIYDNSTVIDSARVEGDAVVYDNSTVREEAVVCNTARVYNRSDVRGHVLIMDGPSIDSSILSGYATIQGSGVITSSNISGSPIICGHAKILDSEVYGRAYVKDSTIRNSLIRDRARIYGIHTVLNHVTARKGSVIGVDESDVHNLISYQEFGGDAKVTSNKDFFSISLGENTVSFYRGFNREVYIKGDFYCNYNCTVSVFRESYLKDMDKDNKAYGVFESLLNLEESILGSSD